MTHSRAILQREPALAYDVENLSQIGNGLSQIGNGLSQIVNGLSQIGNGLSQIGYLSRRAKLIIEPLPLLLPLPLLSCHYAGHCYSCCCCCLSVVMPRGCSSCRRCSCCLATTLTTATAATAAVLPLRWSLLPSLPLLLKLGGARMDGVWRIEG